MRLGGQTLDRRRANVRGDGWRLCCRAGVLNRALEPKGKRIGPMTEKRRRDEPQSGLPNGGPASNVKRALRSIVTVQASIPEDAYHRADSGRAADGQRRRDPRERPCADDRLPHHRGRARLDRRADGRVTPGPRARHRSGDRLRPRAGARSSRLPGAGIRPVERGQARRSGDRRRRRRRQDRCRRCIVAKQEFAGYWEYFLDEAIFTAPAHPFWGGAGAIDARARCSASARCMSSNSASRAGRATST